MKSYLNALGCLSLSLLWSLSACKGSGGKGDVPFGEVTYYPKFLWTHDSMKPATKTFEFDFSPDAKNDKECFAEFGFVDNDGKAISTDVMQVSVDDLQLENNVFRVNSSEESKKVEFRFSPDAEGGKHQGYLKLTSHNLDRLGPDTLSPGEKVDEVLQWTLVYHKTMNPLAKAFMWTGIFAAIALVFWFGVLRPSLYPRFGTFKKSILVRKDNRNTDQFTCSFKGARKVVFSTKRARQSFLNKLFVGEIRTVVKPYFTSELTFTPRNKGRKAFARGKGYSANPNPIPKNGLATIENAESKLTMKFT